MRSDRPSLLLKITAIGGLLFLHLPILFIFLYAFTTEERTYQFPPPGLTLKWFAVAWERPDIWPPLCNAVDNPIRQPVCHRPPGII